MPVAEQNPVNSYTGNGVTTTFPYTFKIFAAADLKVTVDGALQTLNVHYSVTGAGDAGGGNVVFVNAPDNATHNPLVIIYRDLAFKRDTDYVENGDFLSSTADDDFDRAVMLIQQLKDDRNRAIKFPKGETADQVLPAPATRANRAIGFDASGAMAMLVPTTDGLSTILSQANNWTSLLQTNLNADKVDGIDAATLMAGRKNLIINGDFRVQQEGTSKAGITTPTFMDLTYFPISNSGTWTLAYDTTSLPTEQLSYALKATVTTADAAVNANDYAMFQIAVEGFDYKSLYKKSQTISFWVKSNKPGIYGVSLRNSINDRSYISEIAINAADTWEKKTVTITASPSGGTWALTNGAGIYLGLALVAGTAYHTTAGAWQSGNYLATANQVNLADTINNYIAIADVQLEAGAAATDFERRPFALESQMVRRYYERINYMIFSGDVTSGASYSVFWVYSAQKRAQPTITFINSVVSGFPVTDPVVDYNSIESGWVHKISSSTVNGGYYAFSLLADARL